MTYVGIVAFSVLGFAISWHIFWKKKRNQPLVCFLGHDCNVVVQSKYNMLLGVPNEEIGMGYYAATAIGALLVLFVAHPFISMTLTYSLFVSGAFAALFSFILLTIQAVVLKQWCEYCMGSAAITFTIFILEFLSILALLT